MDKSCDESCRAKGGRQGGFPGWPHRKNSVFCLMCESLFLIHPIILPCELSDVAFVLLVVASASLVCLWLWVVWSPFPFSHASMVLAVCSHTMPSSLHVPLIPRFLCARCGFSCFVSSSSSSSCVVPLLVRLCRLVACPALVDTAHRPSATFLRAPGGLVALRLSTSWSLPFPWFSLGCRLLFLFASTFFYVFGLPVIVHRSFPLSMLFLPNFFHFKGFIWCRYVLSFVLFGSCAWRSLFRGSDRICSL